MADPTTDPTPPTPPAPEPPKPADPPAPEGLGDAGKRAIEAEREARRTAEARAKELDAELDKLRKAQMSDAEKAVADAKSAATSEADERWTARIVRTEARAAAAMKGLDPDLVIALLDLTKIPVTDGEVDADELDKALEAVAAKKPAIRIGSGTPKPPTPTVPGGPRNDGKGSITREQLRTMKPEQIEAARLAGELDHLLKG